MANLTAVDHIILQEREDLEDGIPDEVLDDLDKSFSTVRLDERPRLPIEIGKLDAEQETVVRDRSEVIRVLAPAGSGKTQTQVNRVLLHLFAGVRADRILMLTFDNAASNSIVGKFRDVLSSAAGSVPQVCTLNAFGSRLLRKYFPQESATLASQGKDLLTFRNAKQHVLSRQYNSERLFPRRLKDRLYLELFSALKNRLIDPRTASSAEIAKGIVRISSAKVFFEPDQPREDKRTVLGALAMMYRELETLYRRNGLMDFDDQKLRALRQLRADTALTERIQGQFDEVIVDEFQDINQLDFELIQEISAKARLVVTGDDDQAIYGFRGCSPSYILQLAEYIGKPVTTLELRRNYRCPKNIVEHATQLIRHNTWRLEKHPIAVRTDAAKIRVVAALQTRTECHAAVAFLERVKALNPELGFNDFAILYRTNAQCFPFQIRLILRDIPYFVRKEDNILESEVLDNLIGVLRIRQAIANRAEAHAEDAHRAFRAYFRYASNDDVHRFGEILSKSKHPLVTIAELANDADIPFQLRKFSEAIKALGQRQKLGDAVIAIGRSFPGLRGMIGSLEDVAENQVPLGEIVELAASYNGKPGEFVSMLERALDRAREIDAGNARENGVSLATYFRSKGLQWHTVILPGCNQKIVPMLNQSIEDERRIFYVAMTRASSNLYISYVKKSCGHIVEPSQFLIEAGLIESDKAPLVQSG